MSALFANVFNGAEARVAVPRGLREPNGFNAKSVYPLRSGRESAERALGEVSNLGATI